jgi:hypothetical protein
VNAKAPSWNKAATKDRNFFLILTIVKTSGRLSNAESRADAELGFRHY